MKTHPILQSSSNLLNIKWDQTNFEYTFDDYPKIVFHNNMYYLLCKGLYSAKRFPKEWTRMEDIGHFDALGTSLTSTPDGLVIYGGQSEDTYYKDMWIYSGDWRPIVNQAPRAFHAACALPEKSAILIHGGINNDEVLSDCVMVDVNTGAVTHIKLNQQLAFSHHTITAIGENKVYLFGGLDKDGHLNPKLYSINIVGEDGLVEEVSNSADTLPTAVRCSHHAFSFFNFLCIAGGYQCGEKLHNCALYDFSHSVWLEIPFSDYMKNAWFVHFDPRGFRIFDSNAKAYQEIYFNKNMQPLSDINDPQLLTFFSRLLNYNISNVYLQEESKQIEKNISSVRLDTSRVFTKKIPTNNPAPKITKLFSEMELLEQATARLTEDYNRQQWHIQKVYQNTKNSTMNEDTNDNSSQTPTDPSVLQQLSEQKKAYRSKIAELKTQIKDNMSKIEAITPLYINPKVSSTVLFDQSEKDILIKTMNVTQLNEDIQNSKKAIERLQNEYEELKLHKKKIETNTFDALVHLQNVYQKSHQQQLATTAKRRKFFELQREIIEKQSTEIELEMSKHDEIKKDYQTYVQQRMLIESLISQITKLESEREQYENAMPQLLRRLSENMNNIMNSANPKNEVDATLELIVEINEIQNNVKGQSQNEDNQTAPKAEERWGLYYENILNILENISEAEKKSIP